MEKKDLNQQGCCKENFKESCKNALSEQELDKVAGGIVSRTGDDDDINDLEVQRIK